MIIISALLFLIVGLIGSLLAFGLIVQIAAAIITGLVAGSLARAIVPGEQPMSWFCTVALGIAGALVSNVAIAFFGLEVGWIGSTIGALVGAIAVLLVIGQARAAGMIILLISATLAGSGCATRQDPTPNVAETRIAAKVVGTPVVFATGVVTWPIGLIGVPGAIAAGDSPMIGLGWPFVWTYVYWVIE